MSIFLVGLNVKKAALEVGESRKTGLPSLFEIYFSKKIAAFGGSVFHNHDFFEQKNAKLNLAFSNLFTLKNKKKLLPNLENSFHSPLIFTKTIFHNGQKVFLLADLHGFTFVLSKEMMRWRNGSGKFLWICSWDLIFETMLGRKRFSKNVLAAFPPAS